MRYLHTYVSQKAACEKAVTYLSRRNILSEFETIKRGHYKFTLHAPTKSNEEQCRNVLARALEGVDYEPAVWAEVPQNEPLVEPATVDMRVHVREMAELAITYAEDGAYHSAARILGALAGEVQAHANKVMPR